MSSLYTDEVLAEFFKAHGILLMNLHSRFSYLEDQVIPVFDENRPIAENYARGNMLALRKSFKVAAMELLSFTVDAVKKEIGAQPGVIE